MQVLFLDSSLLFITFLLLLQSKVAFSKPLVFSNTNNKVESLNNPQFVRGQTADLEKCHQLHGAEKWYGHNATLYWPYYDPTLRVLMYVDTDLYEVDEWVFDFIKKVWTHMTNTYGHFDLAQCLYIIIHSERYAGGRIVYARNSSSTPANINILDIGSTNPNAWESNEPNMDEMNLITNYLAHFVEFSSKNRFGSPSENIWKGSSSEHSAWVDIFTYDVYKSLNYTANAELYRNKSLLKSHNSSFSKNETFWFRDWLLPIYEQFGRNAVLNNYFEILAKDIPPNKENLNIGEFVHLWCGAARFDLTSMAENAFGWNEEYEKLFTDARRDFYGTTNLYNSKSGYSESSTTPTSTSSNEHTEGSGRTRNTTEVPVTSSFKNTQAPNPTDGPRELIIGISAGGAVVFILFAVLVIVVIYYKRTVQNLRTEIRSLTKKEMKDFFQGDSNVNENEAQSLIHSIPFVKDFEVSRDQLMFNADNILGSGEYGCVMKGFIRQLDSVELLPVAIKTVKANVEIPQFKAMLLEAKIMAFLGKHENIVLLCGTYTANIRNREIYIALELCTLGDLRNFLKNNAKEYKHQPFPAMLERNSVEDITSENGMSAVNLYKWSQEISNGMIYLAEKKVIHGDLATRNVLLTSNRVAKISDFGLSRQLLNYAHYLKTARTPLPWRWMAVESLKDMQFSVASDIWAFGVTLWEIFSLGETPYPGWTWDYTFVDRLVAGDRLQAPAFADPSTYELMHDCWKLEATERPSFQTIHNILGELLAKHSPKCELGYMKLVPVEVKHEIEEQC